MIHPSIKSYFEQSYLEDERKNLFHKGLKYVGHKLMAPELNDYQTVSHMHDRFVLVNKGDHHSLLSNVCLHRQAKLVEGRGNSKNISCKVHCWTYSNDGELKAAPHFQVKPNAKLETRKLSEWNGLLFDGRAPEIDLKKAGVDEYLNFKDYFYAGSESEVYNFNWKTFVEIYLENYHVFSMHPGLKKFVVPADLEWHFGEDFSIQKVGLNQDLSSAGTETYKMWHDVIAKQFNGNLPRYGAIWTFIYPNIMLEWYPHTLVVSTIHPLEPQKCVNYVEFYYPKDVYAQNPNYFETEKKVYLETAVEDDEACSLLDKGRKALYLNGEEEYGPVDSFLEAGVGKFYEHVANQTTSLN
jgi:phenylpropionate dioxygenase-like ring-hydroxylating dioxygenase large terminal subunit